LTKKANKPDYLKMPFVTKGMRVGLFGGSFNPPHDGHVLVAEMALKRLKLDQVWWMVTPGNPLKSHKELLSLNERIRQSREICKDPKIKVTGFEATYKLSYTAETLDLIARKNRGVNFVWLMGADNLASFHTWQDWRGIAETFPIAVIDRPGSTLSYLSSKMAKTYAHARLDETDASALANLKPPAWTFLHGPRSSLSSTALRNASKTT
jgi:nicotinate-nucleotide adenylyltransferase